MVKIVVKLGSWRCADFCRKATLEIQPTVYQWTLRRASLELVVWMLYGQQERIRPRSVGRVLVGVSGMLSNTG